MPRVAADGTDLYCEVLPVRLLVGEHTHPFFAEIANRLGRRAGWTVTTAPGRHAAYHDRPAEFADTLRPFLREISAAGTRR